MGIPLLEAFHLQYTSSTSGERSAQQSSTHIASDVAQSNQEGCSTGCGDSDDTQLSTPPVVFNTDAVDSDNDDHAVTNEVLHF
jgi:hypothetical protein